MEKNQHKISSLLSELLSDAATLDSLLAKDVTGQLLVE